MKRFLLLIIIAIGTFLLFALYKNPEILESIWLWVIGLLGTIIKGGRSLTEYFKNLISDHKGDKEEPKPSEKKEVEPSLIGDINISLLRYSDDGETTVGLLYINDKFYCYTLEDTFREVKKVGETRIPTGSYTIDFKKEETELTIKYRTRYSEWFTFHLQLSGVPNFSSIYIHSGGDHTDTEGCILVSDSLSISDTSTFLTNSRNTFRTLYKYLGDQLNSNKKIVINIKDEAWFSNMAS